MGGDAEGGLGSDAGEAAEERDRRPRAADRRGALRPARRRRRRLGDRRRVHREGPRRPSQKNAGKAFARFDKDGDGKLTLEEYTEAVERIASAQAKKK
ncbi:MAG: hypothetical protein GC159_16565 [Phycisphaera sp.]|nr:hypothetical protein [Phycisphaera sp.]